VVAGVGETCPAAAGVRVDMTDGDRSRADAKPAVARVEGDAELEVWANVVKWHGWLVAAESLQVASGAGGSGA
jgi:hypothetical protein